MVPATINDNDAVPSISFDSATAETTEGSAISFPVTLSAASGRDITIAYTLTDGTATIADNDYTNPAEADRTLTIPAGDTMGTITVDTGDDPDKEADENFTITLNQPSDLTIVTLGAITEATGTILSNDGPTLSIESKSVNEDVGTVTLKVSLANPGGTAISVPWNTVAGTAHETSDYTANSGTLEFDGTNADKVEEITITIIDDPRDEDNQIFTVQLGNVANVIRLGGGIGTITIEDDDDEPTVTIVDITPQPEDDGMDPASDTVYNIDVTLSHASEKAVSVDFTVTADTAVATHDYVLTNANTTLTFDNESTSEQITLNLKADNIDENNETFSVELTTATNAQFAAGANTPKTVTINDNDDPPVISIDNVEVTEGTDTGGTFTITQTPNSGKSVEVTVTYADVTATEGADKDYQITTTGFDETTKTRTFIFNPANEPTAMATLPLTFTINDDLLNEAIETFSVTLSNPTSSPDFTLNTTNNTHFGTATINDNDTVPNITLDSVTAETTEGSAISFPVTLSAASGRDITIAYTLTDGTATTADSDYTNPAEAGRTLTIPAGDTTGTITVDTGDDSNNEADENFTITLDEPDDSTIVTLGSITEARGTILSDDGPTLSIESKTVDESVETVTLKVRLASPGGTPISIPWNTVGGTAQETVDYTATSGTLEFDGTKADKEKEITITIINDTLNEQTEEFTVTATTTESRVTALNGGVGTITINDNDSTLPTLELVELTGNIVETTDATTNLIHNITVELSANAGREIQVDYSLASIEANIPLDVKLADSAPGRISDSTGVLTIAKGDDSATIPIEIIADYYDEENEKFRVTIEDPVNAELGSNTAITPTIEDNDAAPKVSIAEFASVTETDSDFTQTIAVTLDRASSKPVTVPFTIDVGSTNANDYAFVDEPIVFTPDSETTITPISQVISITIMGDNVGEKQSNLLSLLIHQKTVQSTKKVKLVRLQ